MDYAALPLGIATRDDGRRQDEHVPPTCTGDELKARSPEATHTLQQRVDLVLVLLGKELKVRYRGTVFGYAWSVAYPLAFTLVFFFVFRLIARVPIENYWLFLVMGLFPWQWFQNSLNGANGFLLTNAPLIKKVRFPRSLLVLTGVLNDLVHFVASIPVILAFLLWTGGRPTAGWLWQIPVLVVIQFGVTYGLSLLVATANLFLRDLERLVGIVSMLWLYMTPVLYSWDMVPEKFRWARWLNPMALIISSWRQVFSEGHLTLVVVAAAAGWSILIVIIGQQVYRRLEWRFAELV
jgi:lipopolysaccharide transport system permease protein